MSSITKITFFISLGLKLTHVHKILKFKQVPWLKSCINFNGEQRKNATTVFEKDFFFNL